jgi:hypothetical protein
MTIRMTSDRYRPQRNWGARIRDLVWDGMRFLVLENQLLRLGILAGKGTDLVELNYKPRDLDLIWLAPGGVRNPLTRTVTSPDSRAAFRETYPGGWQELFPNAGLPSTVEGVLHGQHGEVYNLPWDVEIIEDTEEAVAVRCSIRTRTSPCQIEKTIRLRSGEARFRVEERLRNESEVPVPAMWGQHITFGKPFLVPGSRIELPDGITVQGYPTSAERRVSNPNPFPWPIDPGNGTDLRIVPERGTASEMVFLTGFAPDDAWYTVTPPNRGAAVKVAWDGETMPWLWLWQEFGASQGYPWFGRVYTVGLEPCSSMTREGLAQAIANGTALAIGPGETRSFWLELSIDDPDQG